MKDKKNIDRLLKEKFKDFEANPSDSVWKNISNELKRIKERKKGIPIWWKVAGVAASLLLLFTISQFVFNTDTTIFLEEKIVDVDSNNDSINSDLQDVIKKENPVSDVDQKTNIEEFQSEKSNSPTSNTLTNSVASSTQQDNLNNQEVISNAALSGTSQNKKSNPSKINKHKLVNPSSNIKKNALADNTNNSNLAKEKDVNNSLNKTKINELLITESKNTSVTVETTQANPNTDEEGVTELEESLAIVAKEEEEDKLSLTEEVAANEEEAIEDITEEEFKRWSVASNIAPVYFNTLGKGSSIHPQFNNNSKSGDINMSYGISGSYAINKKLSVRAGINKVNLGYSTNDIVVFNNLNSVSTNTELLRNVDLNENNQNLSFISVEEFNFAQVPKILNNFIESSIDQKLGFIEIPIELEYRISNKKIGINLIGGFSALFLTDNETFSVLNGDTTLLGEATNINNTSFSANFGLGFDFKISDKFNFNLEPVFKYQLNTFNNTSGDFQPYFIGIYSGLMFKF